MGLRVFSALFLLGLGSLNLQAEDGNAKKQDSREFQKEAAQQSPSFQQKKWTGTQGSYETNLEYNYVGDASHNLGNGHNQDIHENYFEFRHQFMRHTLLAFLVQGGLGYQHQGFSVPNDALIPDRLDTASADIAIDTRWSEKDLLRVGVSPGFYTDFQGSGWAAINAPVDVGYTRVTSQKFQWVIGFSWNSWRSNPFLGAAGVRWQINERWKIKAYMPQPDVEYVARPNLTLSLGADLRGDSFRVGPHFGDQKGRPDLNNALIDYQEVRVGPGFSWNIKPLLEMNFMTGYMVGRSYDYHNNDLKLNGSGGPFVMIALHALLKLPGEPLRIPQRNRISVRDVIKYF
jgi:hypothetical protein